MLVGLEILQRLRHSPLRKRLKDSKVGVLTHQAAVTRTGAGLLEILEAQDVDVRMVFSPEHGFDGLVEAEEPVEKDESPLGDLRVISLYGTTKESLSPKAEDLEDLDVLVIDLVDVGSRYYTYVWTALLTTRAAHQAGVHVVVLDRWPRQRRAGLAPLAGGLGVDLRCC